MWAKGIAMTRGYRLVAFALCLAAPVPALSHAALVTAETATAIRLQAGYDTGDPMAHAQVRIYAPDDPARPWGQGVTDREGGFEFIPDPLPGRWSVQVRQAGHGAMAYVEVGAAGPVSLSTATRPDRVQQAVMVALVAWGALGTALFALRKRGRGDASS